MKLIGSTHVLPIEPRNSRARWPATRSRSGSNGKARSAPSSWRARKAS